MLFLCSHSFCILASTLLVAPDFNFLFAGSSILQQVPLEQHLCLFPSAYYIQYLTQCLTLNNTSWITAHYFYNGKYEREEVNGKLTSRIWITVYNHTFYLTESVFWYLCDKSSALIYFHSCWYILFPLCQGSNKVSSFKIQFMRFLISICSVMQWNMICWLCIGILIDLSS